MAIGIDQSTVAHYLTGRRTPEIPTLIRMREETNITIDELLGLPPLRKSRRRNANAVAA